MKKSFKHAMLFIAACTMTTGFVACGNDENDNTLVPTTPTNNNGSTSTNDTVPTIDVNNLDFKMAYADKWANYMSIVSGLLKDDATTLYNEWNDRYADYFKAHNNDEYLSALNCVDQILDGCKEIASEVGASKIGEPYNYWVDGDREAAVYAVESCTAGTHARTIATTSTPFAMPTMALVTVRSVPTRSLLFWPRRNPNSTNRQRKPSKMPPMPSGTFPSPSETTSARLKQSPQCLLVQSLKSSLTKS